MPMAVVACDESIWEGACRPGPATVAWLGWDSAGGMGGFDRALSAKTGVEAAKGGVWVDPWEHWLALVAWLGFSPRRRFSC